MQQPAQLPLDKFYQYEKEFKNRVFLKQPIRGEWIDYTWEQVGVEARKLAGAIEKMNLPAKSCIALLSKNCAHWFITDLAIWMAGHITVPLYPTLNSDTIQYIFEHSDAKLAIIGKLDDWDSQIDGVPTTIPRVHFPDWVMKGCDSWEEFLKDTNPITNPAVPTKDELCTIIYTSGTTGRPKGVVHTFNSASTNMRMAQAKLNLNDTDIFFSYLPLSHVAERLLVEMGALYSGGTVYFAESLDTFAANLSYAKPTVFLAVPRIWLKFQQGILAKLPQKKLNILLKIPFVKGLIQKKLKTALGLINTRYAVTGAAAISKDLLLWFDKIDIKILEAYGMTENFAVSNLALPNKTKYGTVGPIFNSDVRIDSNGEVCTRSEATMVEYYKQPEKTAEAVDADGWLHTGDQGEFDSEGFLKITGRIKDAFKTSKGKYVTPTKIESHISMCNMVEQVCVMGTGLPTPIGVIQLSEIGLKASADDLNNEFSDLLKHVNSVIENYERLSHIVIVKDEWTIENGIVTPTLKLKRNIVEKMYAPQIEKWSLTKQNIIRL